jgi:hypothetical protein
MPWLLGNKTKFDSYKTKYFTYNQYDWVNKKIRGLKMNIELKGKYLNLKLD